jgi:antitoxin YefM
MHRNKVQNDIHTLSEFRSRLTYYFNKVKRTKRPLIITQQGKSAAILISVPEYEALFEKIEVLEEIIYAEYQISEDRGYSYKEVKKMFSDWEKHK